MFPCPLGYANFGAYVSCIQNTYNSVQLYREKQGGCTVCCQVRTAALRVGLLTLGKYTVGFVTFLLEIMINY